MAAARGDYLSGPECSCRNKLVRLMHGPLLYKELERLEFAYQVLGFGDSRAGLVGQTSPEPYRR